MPHPNDPVLKRSIIYIDGFNFFYGAVRSTPYKWLDLQSLFLRIRQADSIQRIYYFTAMVDGPGRVRQEAYLRALATCPLVTTVLGRYKQKSVYCGVSACSHTAKMFRVPEEKRTDVNIAVQMVTDAFSDACDRFILVSGDSDLVPGVSRVKERFPEKEVIVYVPSRDPIRGAAVELRSSANKNRNFPLQLLPKSMFPANVPDGSGGMIQKPAEW